MPNEVTFDRRKLKGVTRVYVEHMFGRPVRFDSLDSILKIDW